MSQSLANLVVHLVFSTKSRRPLLRDEERGQLHAYITGILKNHDSPLIEINTNKRISRPSIGGFARRTADRWMNDMRGIEYGGVCRGGIVWPLQGRRKLFGNVYLGLRASRFTPGCHMTGFQPADLSGGRPAR